MNERTIDINTLCKDCTFSILKEGRQVGCTFNRLEKFKEKELVDNKYYKIKGFCNYCRDYKWAKEHLEDMESAVIKETELRIGYILLAKDCDKSLERSLNYLLNQEIKPARIAVVFFNENERVKTFVQYIKKIQDVKIDIVNVLDWSDKENLIDHGARRLQDTHYISVVEEGFRLDSNFSSNLNKQINDYLRKITMVEHDGYNALTIQTNVYKLLGGSFQEPIRDKIRNLAKIQGLEDMIIKYEDIT